MVLGGACGTTGPVSPFPTATVGVGGDSLEVWVADDAAERSQGLMGVSDLPDEIDGMLFTYGSASLASYHMRDTLIPLDIWWFDETGELIGNAEMEPCLDVSCTSYRSPGPVRWVMETPAGEHAFAVGAMLSIVETG